MPLELQLQRSRFFYGRLQIAGRKYFFSLRVPVEGKAPPTLRGEGDVAFERSRLKAQAKLDGIEKQFREEASREELAQRVLEARTGARLGSIRLIDMGVRWLALPRRATPAPRYVAVCLSAIERFAAFVTGHHPAVTEMSMVSEEIAQGFMAQELSRGITGKTHNDVLVLLRSCFHRLSRPGGVAENPFSDIPKRDVETVSREPFTPEVLGEILEAAREDELIYLLMATGASTALRLGDCAQLRWESLDLKNGFVLVKTAKTGAEVEIPILAPLMQALENLVPQREGYVSPMLAKIYRSTPDRLTDRVRQVFSKVGFGDSASGNATRGAFQVQRRSGLRKASVRDFHSFRTTWITLALNAGVPIELVTRVTGQRTVSVVTKRYHQPRRADFREALERKLPNVLTGQVGHKLTENEALLVAQLEAMTAANWCTVRNELLKQIRKTR